MRCRGKLRMQKAISRSALVQLAVVELAETLKKNSEDLENYVDIGGDIEEGTPADSKKRTDILKTFAEHPNRPLSRDWLLETTSHRSRDPFDRAIDLRITRIRRKIEPTPDKPTVIRTVRGIGYMFVPPAE